MVTEVPYTAIIQDKESSLCVRHVNLPMGLERARCEMENRLDDSCQLVAIVQGNMPIGLGGIMTTTTPEQEIPTWPF